MLNNNYIWHIQSVWNKNYLKYLKGIKTYILRGIRMVFSIIRKSLALSESPLAHSGCAFFNSIKRQKLAYATLLKHRNKKGYILFFICALTNTFYSMKFIPANPKNCRYFLPNLNFVNTFFYVFCGKIITKLQFYVWNHQHLAVFSWNNASQTLISVQMYNLSWHLFYKYRYTKFVISGT